jgi:hypothetical protein
MIRTHRQSDVVVIDFLPGDGASGHYGKTLIFRSILDAENGSKPATLSLNACCRIIEEHGGHLLRAEDPNNPAFRVELRVATNQKSRPAFVPLNRTAARSGS